MLNLVRIVDFVNSVVNNYRNLHIVNKNAAINLCSVALCNNVYKPNLSSSVKHCRKILKSDANLVITKDDKGVRLSFLVYMEKSHKLINEGPYVDIHKDPSISEIKALKSAIKTSPITSA